MINKSIEKFSKILDELKRQRTEIDNNISECELILKSIKSYLKQETNKPL